MLSRDILSCVVIVHPEVFRCYYNMMLSPQAARMGTVFTTLRKWPSRRFLSALSEVNDWKMNLNRYPSQESWWQGERPKEWFTGVAPPECPGKSKR